MRSFPWLALLGTTLLFVAACGNDDESMPALKVTYMVDTLQADRKGILHAWRAYLEARPHTYTPKAEWSAAALLVRAHDRSGMPIRTLVLGTTR